MTFDQGRLGLHHLCFLARERADVDALHAFPLKIGATIVLAPSQNGWAPGDSSVLFEDPDAL